MFLIKPMGVFTRPAPSELTRLNGSIYYWNDLLYIFILCYNEISIVYRNGFLPQCYVKHQRYRLATRCKV